MRQRDRQRDRQGERDRETETVTERGERGEKRIDVGGGTGGWCLAQVQPGFTLGEVMEWACHMLTGPLGSRLPLLYV